MVRVWWQREYFSQNRKCWVWRVRTFSNRIVQPGVLKPTKDQCLRSPGATFPDWRFPRGATFSRWAAAAQVACDDRWGTPRSSLHQLNPSSRFRSKSQLQLKSGTWHAPASALPFRRSGIPRWAAGTLTWKARAPGLARSNKRRTSVR